jgi:DNA-binding NarL/FixJ family response regulator
MKTTEVSPHQLLPPGQMPMSSILIVENNDLFRKSLKEICEMYIPTLHIDEASDDVEALQKIKANPPEMIFMDIQLQGKSGLELTKEIKASYPKVIVVVLTAYDLPEYEQQAHACGADHFLVKGSFTGSDVTSLIKSVYLETDSK